MGYEDAEASWTNGVNPIAGDLQTAKQQALERMSRNIGELMAAAAVIADLNGEPLSLGESLSVQVSQDTMAEFTLVGTQRKTEVMVEFNPTLGPDDVEVSEEDLEELTTKLQRYAPLAALYQTAMAKHEEYQRRRDFSNSAQLYQEYQDALAATYHAIVQADPGFLEAYRQEFMGYAPSLDATLYVEDGGRTIGIPTLYFVLYIERLKNEVSETSAVLFEGIHDSPTLASVLDAAGATAASKADIVGTVAQLVRRNPLKYHYQMRSKDLDVFEFHWRDSNDQRQADEMYELALSHFNATPAQARKAMALRGYGSAFIATAQKHYWEVVNHRNEAYLQQMRKIDERAGTWEASVAAVAQQFTWTRRLWVWAASGSDYHDMRLEEAEIDARVETLKELGWMGRAGAISARVAAFTMEWVAGDLLVAQIMRGSGALAQMLTRAGVRVGESSGAGELVLLTRRGEGMASSTVIEEMMQGVRKATRSQSEVLAELAELKNADAALYGGLEQKNLLLEAIETALAKGTRSTKLKAMQDALLEADGIIYGFKRMRDLGANLVDVQLTINNSGHGLDLLFELDGKLMYLEAKNAHGFYRIRPDGTLTTIKTLGSAGGHVQGTKNYIIHQLTRLKNAPHVRANPERVAQIEGYIQRVNIGEFESYISFNRGDKLYKIDSAWLGDIYTGPTAPVEVPPIPVLNP